MSKQKAVSANSSASRVCLHPFFCCATPVPIGTCFCDERVKFGFRVRASSFFISKIVRALSWCFNLMVCLCRLTTVGFRFLAPVNSEHPAVRTAMRSNNVESWCSVKDGLPVQCSRENYKSCGVVLTGRSFVSRLLGQKWKLMGLSFETFKPRGNSLREL